MKNSISDIYSYKNICKLAYEDDTFFNTFKTNKYYNEILEHVTYEQGLLYLDYLNANFPEFIDNLDAFKKNDEYGRCKAYYYYDNVGYISPTTLRYIKVAHDIKSLFDLNGKKVVEIGTGYGGQCFILSQMFNIKEYCLIDLDEVLLLNKKYLDKLNTRCRPINISELDNIEEEFDFVISNYAYSELNKSLQDLYWDKIISRSNNGYFTLNFISDDFGVNSYNQEETTEKFSSKNPKILDENPLTHNNNIILYF